VSSPDTVDVDDAAIRLAIRLEQEVIGSDGAVVIGACCWLLAGVIRQAAHEKGASVSLSIEYVVEHVWKLVGFLERQEPHDADETRA
jgi:hypothetical protein